MLRPLSDGRHPRWKLLVAEFHRYSRVRQHIVVPVRVAVRSAFGRDDDQPVAIGDIGQWIGAGLPTLRPIVCSRSDERENEISHLKELHSVLIKKRRWYEIQLAKYEGPATPFHLADDLDRTKIEIEKTELQLVQLGEVSHLPTSVLDRAKKLLTTPLTTADPLNLRSTPTANEERLAILRQGVEAWNAWRETDFQVLPDLSSVKRGAAGYGEIGRGTVVAEHNRTLRR